ncbi:MAG: peptidylprolyl isomerase, partial [Planctomycetia bacterium]
TLRVKQWRGTLLLALEADRAWLRGTHLFLVLCPDFPEAHAGSPGAVTIDYEPFDHSRPHVLARKVLAQGQAPLEDAVLVRSALRGRAVALEMLVRLPALGVTGSKPHGLRLLATLVRGMGEHTPSWPAGMVVNARPGELPPDLVDSGRWLRLGGWKQPDGPGALGATEWAAALAEDAELARKGADAHAMGLLIAEESGRKLEKQDRDVEAQLLAPLAWIAEREPLHPGDLLARGRALRHLNRHAEALACFDALALDPQGDWLPTAVGERATTLERRERWAEAAAAWQQLARLMPPGQGERYEQAARAATARAQEHAAELAARAADDADPTLPLVELVTPHGSAFVRLHARDVPKAVEHFLRLCRTPAPASAPAGSGFYDGTLFHRVLGDAFLQGGDPRTRNGDCDQDLGGPASTTIAVERNARHGYWRGAVAFARAQRPENGSQFFVLTTPRPDMAQDGYTVFGHVVAGMEALDRVERCDRLLAVRVVAAREAPAGAPPGEAPGTAPAR